MVLSRLLDVLWAFPIYLLAISLSIVLIAQGIDDRPDHHHLGQPVAADLHHRHRLRALCGAADPRPGAGAASDSEFVLAAIGLGVPSHRILLRDILPNVSTTLIVFVPADDGANIAHRIGAVLPVDRRAAARCELGHHHPGRPGAALHPARVALAPGIAIVLTVLALNILGDGVRDALDPRAKIRLALTPWPSRPRRRLGPDAVRHVRHQRPGVPDLLRHARLRSRRAHRRPQRRAGDAGRGAQGFRPRSAAAGAIRADDEAAVRHPRPHLLRQSRPEGDPAGDATRRRSRFRWCMGAAVLLGRRRRSRSASSPPRPAAACSTAA